METRRLSTRYLPFVWISENSANRMQDFGGVVLTDEEGERIGSALGKSLKSHWLLREMT